MPPPPNEQRGDPGRVRPLYKTLIYVAIWLAALFATNPSVGYRAMVYLFPLGLAAFIACASGMMGAGGCMARASRSI